MAEVSKFQDKQVDAILSDMITVMEKHQVLSDLALVVLGNMVTHVLLSSVAEPQREGVAQAFSRALLNSLKAPNS